ncbi:MAG: hypothetical protein KGR26_14005 [Cyanobacteria bacterium REEB65]|nr:hypothetical protein [Cyanobacteria bacterium REEB65]
MSQHWDAINANILKILGRIIEKKAILESASILDATDTAVVVLNFKADDDSTYRLRLSIIPDQATINRQLECIPTHSETPGAARYTTGPEHVHVSLGAFR